MKHWIVIGILLIWSASAARAQDTVIEKTVIVQEDKSNYELRTLELGARYMPTFSSVDFNTYGGEVVRGDLTLSHGWGALVGVNFTKNFGIQAELDYYELSQRYQDRSLEREVNIKYYNIPVLLSLNTDKTQPVNLNLVAGPQFGINAGSDVETSGANPDDTDTLQAVIAIREEDIGLAYGAGLEFMLNSSHTLRLDLGFRGFYGLVDMTSDEVETRNGTSYNVVVKAARQTYAGYGGLTLLF